MMRYIGEGITRTKEEASEKLDQIIQGYNLSEGLGIMLASRKTDGHPIGHAGLVPQTVDGEIKIELGYWINEPFWNNGFATEAAKFFQHYGMNQLRLFEIISIIQLNNKFSKKVALKTGMKLNRKTMYKGKEVYIYNWVTNHSKL